MCCFYFCLFCGPYQKNPSGAQGSFLTLCLGNTPVWFRGPYRILGLTQISHMQGKCPTTIALVPILLIFFKFKELYKLLWSLRNLFLREYNPLLFFCHLAKIDYRWSKGHLLSRMSPNP